MLPFMALNGTVVAAIRAGRRSFSAASTASRTARAWYSNIRWSKASWKTKTPGEVVV